MDLVRESDSSETDVSLCFLESQRAGNGHCYFITVRIKVLLIPRSVPWGSGPNLAGTRGQCHGRQRFPRWKGRQDRSGRIQAHCALLHSRPCTGFASCGQCGPLFTGARGLLAAENRLQVLRPQQLWLLSAGSVVVASRLCRPGACWIQTRD